VSKHQKGKKMELNKEEKEQVEFITDICKEFKPKKVLEIGSGWGISGSTMLSCLPEMHLTTIDPRDDLKEFEARTKIYKDRITKINGRSGENPLNPKYHSKNFKILEKLTDKFDFIYIDGSHDYKDVLYDLTQSLKLINNGGLIALDDYFHKDNFGGSYGVNKAVAEVCKLNNLVFKVYPNAHGMVRINL
jgi:predicted O-methyltransferase YrrM